MFGLGEPMTRSKRLLVSCRSFGAQMLVGVSTWLIATISGIVWTLSRLHAVHASGDSEDVAAAHRRDVTFAATIPVSGYMARKAFAIHGFSAPMRLRFKNATSLGLEAMTWGLVTTLGPFYPLICCVHPDTQFLQ
ncbi:hypothetical protein SAMN05192539_102689 [Paraburkholderia diazotrophica]|uniref:Uncharacterized protein n=1 Tax=Paraburkholderia diazotrophica TaxID=667676 RepID=A0A1H7D4M0_9BURK|nr:hypothetical protein SAMN05192539_102689 [Paraburkholderia diazotrophica]